LVIDQPRLAGEAASFALAEIVEAPPAPMLRDLGPYIQGGREWVGRPIEGLVSLVRAVDGLLVENFALHPTPKEGGRRRLMDFAEQEAQRLGFDRLRLHTNELMTENIYLHAHLDYLEFDRRTESGSRRVYMEQILRPR
jgi:hypothetical protein